MSHHTTVYTINNPGMFSRPHAHVKGLRKAMAKVVTMGAGAYIKDGERIVARVHLQDGYTGLPPRGVTPVYVVAPQRDATEEEFRRILSRAFGTGWWAPGEDRDGD